VTREGKAEREREEFAIQKWIWLVQDINFQGVMYAFFKRF
jgi:hypothetical protein